MPLVRTNASPRSRWPAVLTKPVVCITPGGTPEVQPEPVPEVIPEQLNFFDESDQFVANAVPTSPPRMEPDLVYHPPTPIIRTPYQDPAPVPVREVTPIIEPTPPVSEVHPPSYDPHPDEMATMSSAPVITYKPPETPTPVIQPDPTPIVTPIEPLSGPINTTYAPEDDNPDMTGLDLRYSNETSFRARLEPFLHPRRNAHIDVTGHEEQVLSQCCSRDDIRKDLYETALKVIQSLYSKQIYLEQGKSALLRGLGLELPIKGGPVFTDRETAMILAALWQISDPKGDTLEFERTLYGIINLMIGHIQRPEDEFYTERKVSPPRERHSNRVPEGPMAVGPSDEQRVSPPRSRPSPNTSQSRFSESGASPASSRPVSQPPPSILKHPTPDRTQSLSPIVVDHRASQNVVVNEQRMPDMGYTKGLPSYYPTTPVRPVASLSPSSSDRSCLQQRPAPPPTREIRTFSCPSPCPSRESNIDIAARCLPGLPSPPPIRSNYDPRVPLRGSEAPRQLPSEYYANIRKGSRMRPPGSPNRS